MRVNIIDFLKATPLISSLSTEKRLKSACDMWVAGKCLAEEVLRVKKTSLFRMTEGFECVDMH
jgi:hypothetical protein